MHCNECEREFHTAQCACGWKPPMLAALAENPWIITHCAHQDCCVAIRHRFGRLDHPLCKWHQNGTAHVPSAAPPGCPDPVLPWPWKTEREREEQARKLFWQERFKNYPALYARWIVQPDPVFVPEEPVAS